MGLTKSDLNRKIYNEWRAEGKSHKDTINLFPYRIREKAEKDLKKSFMESHFGNVFYNINNKLALICFIKKLVLTLQYNFK